jgi:hypothetical protein
VQCGCNVCLCVVRAKTAMCLSYRYAVGLKDVTHSEREADRERRMIQSAQISNGHDEIERNCIFNIHESK